MSSTYLATVNGLGLQVDIEWIRSGHVSACYIEVPWCILEAVQLVVCPTCFVLEPVA